MPIIEAPLWDDWPVAPLGPQRYGYFILFRLDTAASVRQLNDEEASRAASLLPSDWYLGLVLSNGCAQLENADGDEFLNFKFCVLGEGLPESAQDSIPIAPAPQVRADRAPIQLDEPLPWSNLYIHTLVNAGGVVTRIHHGTGSCGAVIPEEQQDWVFDCNFADVVVHQNANIANTGDRPAVLDRAVDDDDQRDSAVLGSHLIASTVSFDTHSIEETYDMVRVHVEICLDLASCPDRPAVPATWLDTLTRLKQIWIDWHDRRVEEARRMASRKVGEWARAIENARPAADVDAPGQRVERENEPGALLREDDVSPNDAVDDRREQYREEAFVQRDIPSPAQQVMHDRERTRSCSPRDTPGSAIPAAFPIAAPQVVDESAWPKDSEGRAASASGKDFLRGAASVVRSLLASAKQRTRSLRIAGAQLTGAQRFGRAPPK